MFVTIFDLLMPPHYEPRSPPSLHFHNTAPAYFLAKTGKVAFKRRGEYVCPKYACLCLYLFVLLFLYSGVVYNPFTTYSLSNITPPRSLISQHTCVSVSLCRKPHVVCIVLEYSVSHQSQVKHTSTNYTSAPRVLSIPTILCVNSQLCLVPSFSCIASEGGPKDTTK